MPAMGTPFDCCLEDLVRLMYSPLEITVIDQLELYCEKEKTLESRCRPPILDT
jgi:hypothetical protein